MSDYSKYERPIEDVKDDVKSYVKEKTNEGRGPKIDKLKKIFIPREVREEFRILPMSGENGLFYSVGYFHEIPTNTVGGKKKFRKIYCLKKNEPKIPLVKNGETIKQENGEPIMVHQKCPLCDKHENLLATQDDRVKYKKKEELQSAEEVAIYEKNKQIFIEANKYAPRKFYILKGIDRYNEKNGPKFWRIKDKKDNSDFDKITSAMNEFMRNYESDFMSPLNGCDFSITVGDSKTNKGIPYKSITAIQYQKPTPLHADKRVMDEWLEDEMTWRDIFEPVSAPELTPEEFMDLLKDGKDPFFDELSKKWVYPGNPELEQKVNSRSKSNMDLNKKKENQDEESKNVTIENVTTKDVGQYKDDATTIKSKGNDDLPKDENIIDDDWDDDDLPF